MNIFFDIQSDDIDSVFPTNFGYSMMFWLWPLITQWWTFAWPSRSFRKKNNAWRWLNDFLPLPYQTHPARGAHVARRSEGFKGNSSKSNQNVLIVSAWVFSVFSCGETTNPYKIQCCVIYSIFLNKTTFDHMDHIWLHSTRCLDSLDLSVSYLKLFAKRAVENHHTLLFLVFVPW